MRHAYCANLHAFASPLAVLFMRLHKRPDILLLLRGVRHMVTAHETVTLSPRSTGESISRS